MFTRRFFAARMFARRFFPGGRATIEGPSSGYVRIADAAASCRITDR